MPRKVVNTASRERHLGRSGCGLSVLNGGKTRLQPYWSTTDGTDLSEVYLKKNAVPRIEGVLLRSPKTARLTGRKTKKTRLKGKTMKPKRGLG